MDAILVSLAALIALLLALILLTVSEGAATTLLSRGLVRVMTAGTAVVSALAAFAAFLGFLQS